MKRPTKKYLALEEKWEDKRVRCKALRGISGSGGMKAAQEDIFEGVVACIHSDEAESWNGWYRPTGYMSVRPDELWHDSEEVVAFENAIILEQNAKGHSTKPAGEMPESKI